MKTSNNTVLKLTVKNHAGAMSHITGLFSRRGYNLEGILCSRLNGGELSRMYLLVETSSQIEQIIRQLQKLYDVVDISIDESVDSPMIVFAGQVR